MEEIREELEGFQKIGGSREIGEEKLKLVIYRIHVKKGDVILFKIKASERREEKYR